MPDNVARMNCVAARSSTLGPIFPCALTSRSVRSGAIGSVVPLDSLNRVATGSGRPNSQVALTGHPAALAESGARKHEIKTGCWMRKRISRKATMKILRTSLSNSIPPGRSCPIRSDQPGRGTARAEGRAVSKNSHGFLVAFRAMPFVKNFDRTVQTNPFRTLS